MEIWKDIPDYEGFYQVSDIGRVKSLKRMLPCLSRSRNQITRKVKGKVLTNCKMKSGYLFVNLCKEKKHCIKYIHSLVLLAFVGPKPDDMECCHYDGTSDNNKLENIRYGTHKENMVDDEIRIKGKTFNQKLFEEDVLLIKKKMFNGEYIENIAKTHNLSEGYLRQIKRNDSWKNVPWPNGKNNFKKPPRKIFYHKLKKGEVELINKLLLYYYLGRLGKTRQNDIAKMFKVCKTTICRMHKKQNHPPL